MADIAEWIRSRGINEVECLIPDMNGVLRGKVLPANKLVQFARDWSPPLAPSGRGRCSTSRSKPERWWRRWSNAMRSTATCG